MRVKMSAILIVIFVATLLIVDLGDVAIAKKKDKSLEDLLELIPWTVPTPRPISDISLPGLLPVPTPTLAPISASVSPPTLTIQYTWQNSWPGYDATPVPGDVLSHSARAFSSSPSSDVSPVTLSSFDVGLAEREGLARADLNPWAIISALVGIVCISYMIYLGYVMVKK